MTSTITHACPGVVPDPRPPLGSTPACPGSTPARLEPTDTRLEPTDAAPVSTDAPRAPRQADSAPDPAWLTAQVRPAGSFGRREVTRLRALLDALSACASVVVLDLAAARLRSPRAAEAIDDAARRLEASGGCLLCLNADAESAARLSGCAHVVVMPPS